MEQETRNVFHSNHFPSNTWNALYSFVFQISVLAWRKQWEKIGGQTWKMNEWELEGKSEMKNASAQWEKQKTRNIYSCVLFW